MKDKKSTLYLHIGLHKTGSTFLQREVFPNIDGLYFLKKPNWNLISGYADPTSLARFMASNTGVWDAMGDKFFERVNVECGRNPQEGGELLISDEQGPFGRHRNDPHAVAVHLDKIRSVMKPHFDELKIILIIRRQDTWLASSYAEISGRFKNASQEHFEEWVDGHISYDKNYFWGKGVRIDYYKLLKEICRYIPQKNVKMLPYEMLRDSPNKYVKKILSFTGNKSVDWKNRMQNKRSKSKNEWEVSPYNGNTIWLRPGKLFHKMGVNPRVDVPSPFRDRKITLTDRLTEKVLSFYKSSNNKIERKLSVSKYGYT